MGEDADEEFQLPEVEFISLLEHPVPKYGLRTDYLTQRGRYHNQEFSKKDLSFIIRTPTLLREQEELLKGGLTPEQVDIKEKYREIVNLLHYTQHVHKRTKNALIVVLAHINSQKCAYSQWSGAKKIIQRRCIHQSKVQKEHLNSDHPNLHPNLIQLRILAIVTLKP